MIAYVVFAMSTSWDSWDSRAPLSFKEKSDFFAITYLVPYLPVTPTFLVRFVILIDVYVVDFGRG